MQDRFSLFESVLAAHVDGVRVSLQCTGLETRLILCLPGELVGAVFDQLLARL